MDKATIIIRIRSKGENGGRKSEEGSLPVIFVISTNNTVENVMPMSDICHDYNDLLSTITQIAYFPPCDNREQNNRLKKSNKKTQEKTWEQRWVSPHSALPGTGLLFVRHRFSKDGKRKWQMHHKNTTTFISEEWVCWPYTVTEGALKTIHNTQTTADHKTSSTWEKATLFCVITVLWCEQNNNYNSEVLASKRSCPKRYVLY